MFVITKRRTKNVGERRMDKNRAVGDILYQVVDVNDIEYILVSTMDKNIAQKVFKNAFKATSEYQHLIIRKTPLCTEVPELLWVYFESNDVENELYECAVEGAHEVFNPSWCTDNGRCWTVRAKTRSQADAILKKQYGIVLTTPKEA